MVRQTNQHLWMTQANVSRYWCCHRKIYIFMLSKLVCGGYSVRYGDGVQEKRTIHSRSREEDGRKPEVSGG